LRQSAPLQGPERKNGGAQGGGGAPPFCQTPEFREEEIPVIQARLVAGIGCGGIREEEDAAAKARSLKGGGERT